MAGAERVRGNEGGGESTEELEEGRAETVGYGEDLGFYPKEGRSPGRLQAEEGHHLTSSYLL